MLLYGGLFKVLLMVLLKWQHSLPFFPIAWTMSAHLASRLKISQGHPMMLSINRAWLDKGLVANLTMGIQAHRVFARHPVSPSSKPRDANWLHWHASASLLGMVILKEEMKGGGGIRFYFTAHGDNISHKTRFTRISSDRLMHICSIYFKFHLHFRYVFVTFSYQQRYQVTPPLFFWHL